MSKFESLITTPSSVDPNSEKSEKLSQIESLEKIVEEAKSLRNKLREALINGNKELEMKMVEKLRNTLRIAESKKREIEGKEVDLEISLKFEKDEEKGLKEETITINIEKQLEYFKGFYGKHHIELPKDFKEKILDIWSNNYDVITGAMKENRFDEILLIPEGLALPDLHTKMTEGYGKTYHSDNFKEGGSFEGVKESKKGPRIVLVHKSDAQSIYDREEIKKDIGKKAEEYMKTEDMNLTDYLIFQRQYFETTRKHLDQKGWVWLPGSTVSKKDGGFRIVSVGWDPGGGRLGVGADVPGSSDSDIGCRPSRSFY